MRERLIQVDTMHNLQSQPAVYAAACHFCDSHTHTPSETTQRRRIKKTRAKSMLLCVCTALNGIACPPGISRMVLVDTRDAIGALDDLSFKGAAAAAAAAILSTVRRGAAHQQPERSLRTPQ